MPGKHAFVIGHPIAHSRSPMMHGYWLKTLAIEGTYEPLDVPPEGVSAFFAGFRDAGWIGGNVTVPHKTAVIPHLDAIDAEATAIGAVNTVWWQDGRLMGGNTDASGFLGSLDEAQPGWDATARRAVILGSGGATRAAAHGLLSRGLEVAVCNRTPARSEALARDLGGRIAAHGWEAAARLMPDCDLLVNCTSLGMVGQPPLQVELASLKPGAVVYDVIYVPLETDLLKQARARGHPVVDGLGMLMHQGAEAFGRWFHQPPPVTPELRRLLEDDIRAGTPHG